MQEPATVEAPQGPSQELQPESPPAVEEKPSLTETIEQPEAQPEPTEGGEPGAETTPETPPWTSAKTVEEALEHDAFASPLDERDRRTRSEVHSRLQPIYQRALESAEETRKAISETTIGFQAFASQVESLMAEGNTDANEWRRIFREHARTLAGLEAAVGGVEKQDGVWAGASQVVYSIAKTAGDDALGSEFSQRMAKVRQGVDPTWAQDFLDRLGVGRVKSLTAENDRLKKSEASLKAQVNDLKGKRNAEEGPANLPGSSGGGKLTAEQWTSMSTAERNKARAEGRHPLA